MRRSLTLVAIAGILPIVALGGAFGVVELHTQRQVVSDGTDAASRFIATLAAVRLGDGMREVDMIAQSPAFDGAVDADRFRALALRLRDTNSNWRYFSVANPSGRRILDVPEPIGTDPNGPVLDRASLARVVATRRPAVGNLLAGPRHRYAFAVRAPVIRNGTLRYVVSAVIPAEAVRPLLAFRRLPSGWRAGIVDGAGNVVATSSPDADRVGQSASRPGRDAKRSGRPGFYRFTRPDGTKAIAAWMPIAGTDWSVHVSAPASDYSSPVRSAWSLVIGIALLCLLLLAVLVRLLAAELKQYREREIAEVQRQRMEALGRLTGGVAHDFNNLLTPVLGGLDLLRMRVSGDEKAMRYADSALASAERARTLVARLLAFSRRQPLAPTAIDLPQLLAGLRDLLERSVGPSAAVALDLPADLPPVLGDQSQLELAILNLAINARDAMPDGGTVRITAAPLTIAAAADLAPGRYVAISVADSGTGMDAATLAQAIDPFFTTKSIERGTGLGLSMVHGFAAQSDGALRLASTPGAGTTATIVMPQAAAPARADIGTSDRIDRGDGHVLLVDDDAAVRGATAAMLREGGYSVDEAASVDEALSAIADGRGIDIVVTDYLMPERTGADLIRALRGRGDRRPILLITGYADTAQDVPADVPRLSKPFRAGELLRKVRPLLAEAAS